MRSVVLPSETRLIHPPALPFTALSSPQIQTSTRSWSTWEYGGRPLSWSPSGACCHILASTGTWTSMLSTSWGRRKPNTWLPLRSGKQSTPTISSKHKSYTGSFTCLPGYPLWMRLPHKHGGHAGHFQSPSFPTTHPTPRHPKQSGVVEAAIQEAKHIKTYHTTPTTCQL